MTNTAERAPIPVAIPTVPFGPETSTRDSADAGYYREAARNIRYQAMRGNAFSGSHVTEAVAQLCDAVADALSSPGLLVGAPTEELRIDDDFLHIYWRDPVEGCWVAYRRVDCVGEEELPTNRLAAAGVAPQKPSPVASTPTVSDDSGHGGDDDRGGREDGPEDEGRSHQATVAGTPQEPSGCAVCHRADGHKMDCSLRATLSPDREKLIAEAREAAIEVDWYHTRGAELLREAADALAAPPEVDEAKLAELLASAANHEVLSSGGTLGAGVSAEGMSHLARDVAEWLRGDELS
ncbi:hypothetical protein [Leucobacter massiliensis]|uniref:Uncharacterized protein n=1 Tax=Leucobacter massiliensis TaxID=1686285 RepID=A0A2S9QQM7_9MICO|nr:hypothetical protein [Leucobacter massiliensis]PRI11899.1 hypothetical protein B4915_02140 [Leucobacter massiliensis]